MKSRAHPIYEARAKVSEILRIDIAVKRWHYPLALSPFSCLPLELPDPLSAGLTVSKGLFTQRKENT
jgi:hypothetical protein